MAQVGVPIQIDEATFIIDIGYFNAACVSSVYLIKGERTCIIDTGTAAEVPILVKGLRAANSFPPDIIALTHAHFDHCQGVPKLRQIAKQEGREIEVVAHETGVDLLADQSFNRVFDRKGRYEDIKGVNPLKEGDVIDLGGQSLRIYHTPGHCDDHMSLLHEQTGRLYVGDTLGLNLGEGSYIPPFMPANWNMEKFKDTIEKIRSIEFREICMAHYGCFPQNKSRKFIDMVVDETNLWWSIYKQADEEGKIRDYDYLSKRILEDTNIIIPDIELLSMKLKVGVKLLNAVRKLRGKESLAVAEIFMHDTIIPWLSRGYRLYNQSKST